MQTEQKESLIWFRNDLRVGDNQSLFQARSKYDRLIAVYCFDPRHYEYTEYGFRKTEKFRTRFLIESVAELKTALSNLNISIIIIAGKPESAIPDIVEKYGVKKIFCQKEWTQEEVSVLNAVRDNLPASCSIYESNDQFLYHPDDIPMKVDDIPNVFTTFRKVCEKQGEIRPTTQIPSACHSDNLILETGQIPSLTDLGFEEFETDPRSVFPFKGGESQAIRRLDNYFFKTKKLGFYKKTRNGLLGTDYSSKFSPWLANGCISPRQIYWEVRRFEKENYKNQSTYWLIFELIWRDFFKYISLKHGNKIFQTGGILSRNYAWETSPELLQSWISGNTPEPFVNANMNELNKTGWMSNRGRQNVASYLAKEMKIDWRMGAAYFESLLIDYDVHSNYGNWMYVAGVGNDPRDRKFNVKLQAERYDPQGKFQNLWLQPRLF